MKKTTLLVISTICLSSFHVFGQEETIELSCTDCHSDLVSQAVMHYPAEDACDNCHMSRGNEHPQDNVKGFDMADEMPGLCFLCHEQYEKSNIHAPSEMGECLMCHSPHGSPNKALLIKAPQSALCAECHDMEMTEGTIKHKPVAEGSCTGCHDPHQSDNSALMISEKPGLCMQCHTKESLEAGMETIHYPFEDDCSNCHSTHSSEQNGLLNERMPDLCYMCHDMQSAIEEAAVVHKVIHEGKACSNCHSPHASGQGMLLRKEGKDMCLDCHSKPIETDERILANIGQFLKEGMHIHGVIALDGCIICHSPHTSDNALLLNGTFPQGMYAEASAENFDLCFSCHDAELMEAIATTTATNFRNKEQNLHYFHIRGEKGRNCNLCHNVHGSQSEHLIADKVWFGDWEMPMIFQSDENGGSCLTGCHAEKIYRR